MKLKKYVKPILLIMLVAILAVLIMVPAKNYAADVIHIPGQLGNGKFGITCWCPEFQYISCGCAVPQQ